jgi:hypothetical protein
MTKTGCMTRCKPYSILQFRMDLMCYNCFFAKFRVFVLVNGQKSLKSLFLICTCEISQKSSYSTLNPYGTAKCYKVCIWSCNLFWSSFSAEKIPGKKFFLKERGGGEGRWIDKFPVPIFSEVKLANPGPIWSMPNPVILRRAVSEIDHVHPRSVCASQTRR